MNFMKGSQDTITSNLEVNDFEHLVSEFPANKLEILKDAYPYKSVDSYEKFNYASLPEKKYFYSSLRDGKRDRSDRHISDEQDQHL